MSNIQQKIDELIIITTEIQKRNKDLQKLRIRKRNLEKEIYLYTSSNNLPGVKHNGRAILVEEKSSHARKKKSEQQQASISILQKYGINNPEIVLNELLTARQGEEISIPKVKVKAIKR